MEWNVYNLKKSRNKILGLKRYIQFIQNVNNSNFSLTVWGKKEGKNISEWQTNIYSTPMLFNMSMFIEEAMKDKDTSAK